MAYAVPPRFEYLETVSAAQLNILNQNLIAIDDGCAGPGSDPARGRNIAVRTNQAIDAGEVHGFFMVHRLRYLHHLGPIELIDLSNQQEPVESGSEGEWGVYDLEGVAWLAPGIIYEVKDCTFCLEDSRP